MLIPAPSWLGLTENMLFLISKVPVGAGTNTPLVSTREKSIVSRMFPVDPEPKETPFSKSRLQFLMREFLSRVKIKAN